VRQATGCTKEEAESAFEASGLKPKIAIIMVLLKVNRGEAERLEKEGGGLISEAVRIFGEKRDGR
jgi:N-acetylmuramic acid 6-phosphate (MurNAc-6-P) etherase